MTETLIGKDFLENALSSFHAYKALAEWAIEQVGRCDTEAWTILPEGATYTPYDVDNPDHNPHGRS